MAIIIPQLNQDPESQTDSGSGSSCSSDSGSDSSSGSESELPLLRPIFLKKKQKTSVAPKYDLNLAVLAKAEHLQQIESKSVEKVPFDGIDDSDDIDPEEEYLQWRLREAARKKRDADVIAQAEMAKEDAVRRKRGVLHDGPSENKPLEGEENSGDKGLQRSTKLGAFYNENLDDKFLKRDYKDVEGMEDHSRPTKYKKA